MQTVWVVFHFAVIAFANCKPLGRSPEISHNVEIEIGPFDTTSNITETSANGHKVEKAGLIDKENSKEKFGRQVQVFPRVNFIPGNREFVDDQSAADQSPWIVRFFVTIGHGLTKFGENVWDFVKGLFS